MVIEGSRSNHLQLHAFLTGLFQCGHDGVELYGCWDGDFDEDAGEPLAIQLSAISDEKFHFRERRLYILCNPEAGVVTAIG